MLQRSNPQRADSPTLRPSVVASRAARPRRAPPRVALTTAEPTRPETPEPEEDPHPMAFVEMRWGDIAPAPPPATEAPDPIVPRELQEDLTAFNRACAEFKRTWRDTLDAIIAFRNRYAISETPQAFLRAVRAVSFRLFFAELTRLRTDVVLWMRHVDADIRPVMSQTIERRISLLAYVSENDLFSREDTNVVPDTFNRLLDAIDVQFRRLIARHRNNKSMAGSLRNIKNEASRVLYISDIDGRRYPDRRDDGSLDSGSDTEEVEQDEEPVYQPRERTAEDDARDRRYYSVRRDR
jgi:hypothetical protein